MHDVYEYLDEILDLNESDIPKYSINFAWFEDVVVRPGLEKLGFYAINFHPSEANMFGPETRVVTCLDQNGKFRSFIYN